MKDLYKKKMIEHQGLANKMAQGPPCKITHIPPQKKMVILLRRTPISHYDRCIGEIKSLSLPMPPPKTQIGFPKQWKKQRKKKQSMNIFLIFCGIFLSRKPILMDERECHAKVWDAFWVQGKTVTGVLPPTPLKK